MLTEVSIAPRQIAVWCRALTFAAIAIVAALAFAGCGGGANTSQPKPITVQPPTTPVAADCGLTGGGSARNAEKPPKPGVYSYATVGQRIFLGEKKRVTQLPSQTKIIVTPNLRKGAQSCFAMQRLYEKDLGDTGVFVINGSDTYLRSGRFQAGADLTEFTPNPSLLAISGSDLDWSNAFQGQTSGRYQASVVGHKRMSVGGVSVPVVGFATRTSYAGDIKGFEQSTRWFSLQRSVVVEENVVLERAFGLDKLRLKYKSRLRSLDPS